MDNILCSQLRDSIHSICLHLQDGSCSIFSTAFLSLGLASLPISTALQNGQEKKILLKRNEHIMKAPEGNPR